jgi:hypothetical protein
VSFLAGHDRILDRRRLGLSSMVPTREPSGAMHAFEVLGEVAALTSEISPRSAELCDWLDRHPLDDGGWPVDFASSSPVAALEWRGCATVAAVRSLRLGAGG